MAFWTDVSPNTRDPKRSFRFLLTIPAINQSWAVKKVTKPNFTVGESTHTFINHKFYYPARVEWEKVTATLVDPITPYDTTAGVMQYLHTAGYRIPGIGANTSPYSISKSKAVFNNPLHKYASAGNVSAQQSPGDFLIKAIDGEGNSVEEWRLFNAWISSARFGEHDYDSDDLINIDVEIRFDYANYKHTFQGGQAWANDGADTGFALKDNPK